MTEYSFYNCIRCRCQTKYLTSAKVLTYYCLSAILLVREKEKFGDYFLDVCCIN